MHIIIIRIGLCISVQVMVVTDVEFGNILNVISGLMILEYFFLFNMFIMTLELYDCYNKRLCIVMREHCPKLTLPGPWWNQLCMFCCKKVNKFTFIKLLIPWKLWRSEDQTFYNYNVWIKRSTSIRQQPDNSKEISTL